MIIKLKNKKAQVGESLSDIVGLIAIVFLLIIFYIFSNAFFSFSEKDIKNMPEKQALHNQEHVSLDAFLQKQIIITKGTESQTITMAELIKLSKINLEYKTILDDEANKAFGAVYDFEILSQKEAEQEAVKMGWQIDFTQPVLIVTPEPRIVNISFFYLPSNEIIFVKLEAKK